MEDTSTKQVVSYLKQHIGKTRNTHIRNYNSEYVIYGYFLQYGKICGMYQTGNILLKSVHQQSKKY